MTESLLPIIEIFKVFVMTLIGVILLAKWFRGKNRFYTDMPFLFGIAMLFAAVGESLDVLMDLAILPPELVIFKIRTTIVTFTLIFWLIATLLIWFNERPRLGYLIIIIYLAVLLSVTWLAPEINLVRLWVMPFLFVLFIVFIVTFILAWYWKRLPDVHGLVMAIGVIIAMFGQALKVPLSITGLTWVSEILDLIGLSILALGLLIKPGYAKTGRLTEYQ
jgi:hypothetical protein